MYKYITINIVETCEEEEQEFEDEHLMQGSGGRFVWKNIVFQGVVIKNWSCALHFANHCALSRRHITVDYIPKMDLIQSTLQNDWSSTST